MGSTWKQNRRFIKETLRFWLNNSIKAENVQKVLNLLTPFNTEIPLIRVGGCGDGGYLLPDDLDGIVACFSPGVDATMTFDTEIMERGNHASSLMHQSKDWPHLTQWQRLINSFWVPQPLASSFHWMTGLRAMLRPMGIYFYKWILRVRNT